MALFARSNWYSFQRRWGAHGWRAPVALVEAWLLLGLARIALLAVPFRRIIRYWQLRRVDAALECPLAIVPQSLDRVAWAIDAAARRTPWASLCLAQALAASAMLRWRRQPHLLVLGAAPPAAAGDSMTAHAWLCTADRILCGGPGHERYAVVGRFVWSPETVPAGDAVCS